MRRLLLVVLALCACDDSTAKPPAPAAQQPAAPRPAERPFEARFDDEELATRVVLAARSGKVDDLAGLALPPRCDRVRVAVKLLHDQVLGVGPQPELPKLLDALDSLSRAKGGASAQSLGPLVAAWRGWDASQIAAEKDLAERLDKGVAALSSAKRSPDRVLAVLDGAPARPPKSPSAAGLAMLRAAVLAIAAPGDAVPAELQAAYDEARAAYLDLGWPGGLGRTAEEVGTALLRADPKSFRAVHLVETAQAAYGHKLSADELNAALVFHVQSDAAERAGDVVRADRLASAARDRIAKTGARGRELYAVMKRHGELALRLGRNRDAARDLRRAWDEAAWAQIGDPERFVVAQSLASALFRLGRFAECRAVCEDAARAHDAAVAAGAPEIEPVRSELWVIAGQAALETGDPAAAADLLSGAVQRLRKAAGDDAERRREVDRAQLMLAGALFRRGDREGGERAVLDLLREAPARTAANLANAAFVLREAGLTDQAERMLDAAEKEGGPQFAAAAVEERALLAAARGDVGRARELFTAAVERATDGGSTRYVGWPAARPMLAAARMELRLGRVAEAAVLAGDAVVQLREVPGQDFELDRARKLFVDLQRRLLRFDLAEKATVHRFVEGPPADAERLDEALLDLLFIRLELLSSRAKDAETNAADVLARCPEGWKRELATSAVDAARTGRDADPPALPDDAPRRWVLLRDVLAMKVDDVETGRVLCARCGESEPELRRAVGAKLRTRGQLFGLEMRRVSVPAEESEIARELEHGDAVGLVLEPFGDRLEVVTLWLSDVGSDESLPGDGGLDELFVKSNFGGKPEEVRAAVDRLAKLLPEKARLVIVSVPASLGPLPFDLMRDRAGDDRVGRGQTIVQVESLTEYVRAKKRVPPGELAVLSDPHATLDVRHALMQVGVVDRASRARFLELVDGGRKQGKSAVEALMDAKRALRGEWAAGSTPPAVPPWSAFVLRGAP